MFKIGPNPYGLTCTLGIQGQHPNPKDLDWYVGLAIGMGGRSIEFHFEPLLRQTDAQLDILRSTLEEHRIAPVVSGPWPLERLAEGFPIAKRLGARTVRTHLSPVLCGDRAELGPKWDGLVRDVRASLARLGPLAYDLGLSIAIEDHQDFGSRELLDFCEIGGPAVGICLDTGNPLAVGEDPVAFAARVAPRVKHIHLKDYRAHRTSEGYRLVRCAIGDGAVPLRKIHAELSADRNDYTATLEPGALSARHIRLLTDRWREKYMPECLDEIPACFETVASTEIPADTDWRTPWERDENIEDICRFEQAQMTRSIENMKGMGWLGA
ncbi:MAG: sugar phosphate isomerase/epimerase [Fimbriimonas sp.]|nr:sugar phosphate isomerase/epimerase [Fimbriimonas sp.]